MTQLLSALELKKRLRAVLRALAQGETFLLVEDGRPLAQLVPLPREALPRLPSEVSDVKLHLERALAVLGEASLSRVLGLTQLTFVLQRADGTFAPAVWARLVTLSNALGEQAAGMSGPQMRAWWRRAHRELMGRSPVDHLALPWSSGDARSRQVFDLIRRQRLLQDARSR